MKLFASSRLNPNQTANQLAPSSTPSKLSCFTKTKAPAVSEGKQPTVAATTNGSQHKLTEYFPVRRSVRKTKKTVLEERQRTLEEALAMCKEEGLEVSIRKKLDLLQLFLCSTKSVFHTFFFF